MTEAAVVQPPGPWYRPLVENVAVNPAEIRWPTDEHGITSDLKKALSRVGTACKGNAAKEEVLIATLMVGLAHIRKRVKKDAEVQRLRIEHMRKLAEQRAPLERFNQQINVSTLKEATNGTN